MKKILLVCNENDAPTTGFAVRVQLMAESLKNSGNQITILRLYNFLQGKHSWQGCVTDGIQLIEIPIPPGLRVGLLITLSQIIRSIVVHCIALWKRVDVIQAENPPGGDAATIIRWSRIPVFVDFHGAAAEEALLSQGEAYQSTTTFKWIEKAEQRCIAKADQIFVVAQPMVDYLKNKYPALDIAKVRIIPVAVDNAFFEVAINPELRRALGFSDSDVVFVYSGGAQLYQCIAETISIFKGLHARINNAKLLILSIEKAKIAQLVSEIAPMAAKDIQIMALSKRDVPEYLAIADVGFLLRQENTLNRVSCPTKFAEYLACGIPVITTASAGHAPFIVEEHGVGVIVDPSNEEAAVESICALLPQIDSDYRLRCKRIARQYLHWDQTMERLEEAYGLVADYRLQQ